MSGIVGVIMLLCLSFRSCDTTVLNWRARSSVSLRAGCRNHVLACSPHAVQLPRVASTLAPTLLRAGLRLSVAPVSLSYGGYQKDMDQHSGDFSSESQNQYRDQCAGGYAQLAAGAQRGEGAPSRAAVATGST